MQIIVQIGGLFGEVGFETAREVVHVFQKKVVKAAPHRGGEFRDRPIESGR
jgi:hypothetical protein